MHFRENDDDQLLIDFFLGKKCFAIKIFGSFESSFVEQNKLFFFLQRNSIFPTKAALQWIYWMTWLLKKAKLWSSFCWVGLFYWLHQFKFPFAQSSLAIGNTSLIRPVWIILEVQITGTKSNASVETYTNCFYFWLPLSCWVL